MTERSIPEQLRAERIIELGQLQLRSQREGDVHTIALSGEMDLSNAGEVERELRQAETTDAQTIVVDLSRLQFMDSTGIRLLIAADARVARRQLPPRIDAPARGGGAGAVHRRRRRAAALHRLTPRPASVAATAAPIA